jgi:hypothetical protein
MLTDNILLSTDKILLSNDNSVAKGPKFRPQNLKGALKKFVRQEKLVAKFSLDLPKRAEKGPNFLEDYCSLVNGDVCEFIGRVKML